MWFIYEDWTLEENPRCFYVGKGTLDRVKMVKRNNHHKSVIQKYGFNRIIVFETHDEQLALNEEIRLISSRHTFVYDPNYNGVGANHTLGGEGKNGDGKPILKCDAHGNVLEEFVSVKAAAKTMNINVGILTGILTGRRKTKDINGFTWKYKHLKHVEIKKQYKTRANCKSLIVVDEHGNIIMKYDSIIDAAHALDVPRMIISAILNGKKQVTDLIRRNVPWKSTWNIQFKNPEKIDVRLGRKVDKKHIVTYKRSMKGVPKSLKAKAKLATMRSKPVVKRSVITGNVITTFPSIKAAQQAENYSKSMMINLVHSGAECNGFVWSFLRKEDHKRQGWKHKKNG